jgi:tRNA (guanine37-N1)-methyltransferase
MHFAVVTIFPEMFRSVTEFGVIGRACANNLLKVDLFNPRDFVTDNYKRVDDRPYGGGPGMVMLAEPLQLAIQKAKSMLDEKLDRRVIHFSPQGKKIKQQDLEHLAGIKQVVFVTSRYEGIDQRVVDLEIDEEWSIGDYVLSGGELPAMVCIDAVARLIPGVLGDNNSAKQDSFSDGLLDCPHYTRPVNFAGLKVPEVLLGGNHQEINNWRLKQKLGRTWEKRPDLLEEIELDKEQRDLLQLYQSECKGDQYEQNYS